MRLAAAIAVTVVSPAFAGENAEKALLALEGDIEYGAYLASECTGSLQASGVANGIPAIVGWDEGPFRMSMLDYRTKAREHPIMNMIAGRLGDEEIAALSVYFRTLKSAENR